MDHEIMINPVMFRLEEGTRKYITQEDLTNMVEDLTEVAEKYGLALDEYDIQMVFFSGE